MLNFVCGKLSDVSLFQVNHTIFAADNLHAEVGFRPADQKYSRLWLVVLLLYSDNEIFFEPQGVQVQSQGKGFSHYKSLNRRCSHLVANSYIT
jgi:hypothetical protein